MTVHFIGAGPGAADLITLRAARIIASAPVCLYAGALVPRELLDTAPPGARLVDTADLDLDAITAVVIGGTSLFGGRGTIWGTLLGALIVGVFRNGLALAGLDVLYQTLAVGILVIVAVALSGAVELIQAVVLVIGRACDTSDWITNTIGAVVGGVLAATELVWHRRRTRRRTSSPTRDTP